MSVTIQGADKVAANMQKAAEAIEKAVGDAVREAAMMIERDAKIRVPVDTARLRNSIAAEELRLLLFEVGTNVGYAGYVEFGTRNVAAQPYLGPAVEVARAQYPDLIKEGVKAEML